MLFAHIKGLNCVLYIKWYFFRAQEPTLCRDLCPLSSVLCMFTICPLYYVRLSFVHCTMYVYRLSTVLCMSIVCPLLYVCVLFANCTVYVYCFVHCTLYFYCLSRWKLPKLPHWLYIQNSYCANSWKKTGYIKRSEFYLVTWRLNKVNSYIQS